MGGTFASQFVLDKTLPAVGTTVGAALAPATGGTSLLASPIIQMILGQYGGNLLAGLFGGGQTGFESATQQSLQARSQLIGDLQQQSRGLPTAATRATDLQIEQAQNRLQQSFGASAQRGGTAGTTVARAQQGRLQAAGLQAKTIARGRLQSSAQGQLAQLTGRAPEQQFLAEAQRRQARKSFLGGISGIISEAQAQEQEGILDADTREAIQVLLDFVKGLQGSLVPTGT
jgi:hypothetical protein